MALTDSLISWWGMDEASGGTSAVARQDSHGANTLTDRNTTPSAAGLVSNAASFTIANGEAMWIAEAAQTGLGVDAARDMAISAWFNPSVLNIFQSLIFKGCAATGAGQPGYWLALSSNTLLSRFSDGSNTYIQTTVASAFTAAAWNHLVVNYDRDGNMQVFINNVSKASISIAAQPGAASGTIRDFILAATNAGSFGNFYSGLIDEAAFWGRILTLDEIAELYNAGAGMGYDSGSAFVPRRRRTSYLYL